MAVRKLVQAGHPALRNKNKGITIFDSPQVRKLQKDIIDTMCKADLVGIAAPQIAENKMIFVTHPRNTKARKLPQTDKMRIYINPKIVFRSKKESIIYEGCGSVADGDLFGPVLRSEEIEIEAADEKGNRFRLRCDGLLARIIQHEMGHLEGEEFISKVSDYNKMISRKFYIKNIRNSKLQKENSRITKIEYKAI